jgi:hypoxanthine phosphoribosyltransferase
MGIFSTFEYMAYYNYNDVNNLIYRNLYKLPQDVDLIVCIPRSGMLIGTIISEYRNIPICTLYEYLNDISTEKGTQLSKAKQFTSDMKYNHILLVDDTCSSGKTLINAKEKIKTKDENVKITTFAVFAEKEGKVIIDIFLQENVWPLLPYSVLKMSHDFACFDIDGIFTEEVPLDIDDDGPIYTEFIKNQRPMYIPQSPVFALVTGRLEKYRKETEEWLAKHNIKYKHLFMCPCKNKEERLTMNPALYKATIYKSLNTSLFVESSLYEAQIIKNETNKPVFCTDVMTFI